MLFQIVQNRFLLFLCFAIPPHCPCISSYCHRFKIARSCCQEGPNVGEWSDNSAPTPLARPFVFPRGKWSWWRKGVSRDWRTFMWTASVLASAKNLDSWTQTIRVYFYFTTDLWVPPLRQAYSFSHSNELVPLHPKSVLKFQYRRTV